MTCSTHTGKNNKKETNTSSESFSVLLCYSRKHVFWLLLALLIHFFMKADLYLHVYRLIF